MNGEAIDQFEKRRRNSFARSFNEGSGYVSNVLRIERLTRPIRKREEPVSVLDFGCGSGGFLDVCDHFGFVTAGVDRSPARRDKAGPKIVPSLGHLASDTTFHAITLFEVLEHLDQPADILKSLHRRLKPDGILVLETPNCNGLKGLSTARDCYLAHPLDHINAFTHETLKSIAERQGFKVITRGPVFVSADTQQAIKRLGKHVLRRDGRSTQLYFRKV
jgi:2-polyprenyl-3-methyl-5-hydroxy-6-metoxy-1,4-benzoquinol methylase